MFNRQEFLEMYPDQTFMFADGFDEAILGVYNDRLVYSRTKCIEILVNVDGMSYDEANEYFDFNVECAYVGEQTPIWVDDEYFNEHYDYVDITFSED